jgi:hypothetical protein
LRAAAVVEFFVFLLVAMLEAKDRWSAPTPE